MIAQIIREDSTARSVHSLLKRNLYQFHDHSILAKGLFYKKGHFIQNWKLRSYVVNDFSADPEDHANKDAHLKYFKPQNSLNFHKEKVKNVQKIVKLCAAEFQLGDVENISKCGTVYPQTAIALNVLFEDEDGKKLSYELVFETKSDAEEFIRGICVGARKTRRVKEFLKEAKMTARDVLFTPRLGFSPTRQTSLLCVKCAPNCEYPDCYGWGGFWSCCCCETYTQGGLLCEQLNIHDNGRKNLASVYYTCCQVEKVVCECRMIKSLFIKVEQQCCCVDTRCALPTDKDVPLEISCCGFKLYGDYPRSMQSNDTESSPLL